MHQPHLRLRVVAQPGDVPVRLRVLQRTANVVDRIAKDEHREGYGPACGFERKCDDLEEGA